MWESGRLPILNSDVEIRTFEKPPVADNIPRPSAPGVLLWSNAMQRTTLLIAVTLMTLATLAQADDKRKADKPKRLTLDEFAERFPVPPRAAKDLSARERRALDKEWPIVHESVVIPHYVHAVTLDKDRNPYAVYFAIPRTTFDRTDGFEFFKGNFRGYSAKLPILRKIADDLRAKQKVNLIVKFERMEDKERVTNNHIRRGYLGQTTCNSNGLARNYAIRIVAVEPVVESPVDDKRPGVFK